MTLSHLSEQQVRLLFFQLYDDQIVNPSSDVILTARVLRAIEDASSDGVFAKVIEEGRKKRRLDILASHRDAEADLACVRLLDYIDLEKP